MDRGDPRLPGADGDGRDRHLVEVLEGARDARLVAQRGGRRRVGQQHRRVDGVGLAAGHLRGPPHGLDRAALGRSRVVHPGELHDRARRQPVEGRRHVDGGPPPGEAEHIALVHQFAEQVGRDLAQVLRVGGVVLLLRRGLDHDRVAQSVAGTERVGALGVQLRGYPDLDPYEVTFQGRLQDPGHLEAADAELLGDLDLGFALEVEAAGHGRRLHQLRGPHPQGGPTRRHCRHRVLLTAVHTLDTPFILSDTATLDRSRRTAFICAWPGRRATGGRSGCLRRHRLSGRTPTPPRR